MISVYIARLLICILILVFVIEKGFSKDNEIWTGIEIKAPITKKLGVEFGPELRYIEDASLLNWFISEVGISYDISKHFKTSIAYEYRSGDDKWQHVLDGNLYYKTKFKKIKLIYRLQYQSKLRWELRLKKQTAKRKRDDDHLRNKITVEYDTDSWIKPFAGLELFYLVNNERYNDRFDVIRYYIGIDIDTFKDQEISLAWMYEEEFNVDNPQKSNIFKIFYSYRLPRLF